MPTNAMSACRASARAVAIDGSAISAVPGQRGSERGRGVQQPVGGSQPHGQLPHQLRAADLVGHRGEAADQLDEGDRVVAVGGRRVDHRLQRVTPREGDGHRVLDPVEKQLRGLRPHLRLDLGRGAEPAQSHPDVGETEHRLQLPLELRDPARRVDDPDLDDALALSLGEHPRHVGAAGAQLARRSRPASGSRGSTAAPPRAERLGRVQRGIVTSVMTLLTSVRINLRL